MVTLSAVIVNWNTQPLLARCVENLLTLPVWEKVALESIIVVDNASTDGSREWLAALTDERIGQVLLTENLGYAAACNRGIERTSGDYIVLLNTDAYPRRGSLALLTEYMELHPAVAIAGPQLLFPNGRWQRSGGSALTPFSACLDALGISSAQHVVEGVLWPVARRWWPARELGYVDGACMMLRRAAVKQIGQMDEGFFFYCEDVEYCMRARRKGWKVRLLPKAQVIHLRGGSSSATGFESAVRQRARSEGLLVRRTLGETAWRRVAFWRRLNYGWRMQLARISHQRQRQEHYAACYSAYREAS